MDTRRVLDTQHSTLIGIGGEGCGNTGGIWRFWQEIAVGSGKQPIRELVAFIAVEYAVRSYGCKPIESSVT